MLRISRLYRDFGIAFAATALTTGCFNAKPEPDNPEAVPSPLPEDPTPDPEDDKCGTTLQSFNNAARPDWLQGCITLPATTNYPESIYMGGSGGISPSYPSIPYGTFAINGERKSWNIGPASGDYDVFMIADMYDAKIGRDRTYILLHKETVPGKLITHGCIAIGANEFPVFKEHMREVLKEYKNVNIEVLPTEDGGASFDIEGTVKTSSVTLDPMPKAA